MSTRAAVVSIHERGHVRTVCCILGMGGDALVLAHCFQTFPTVTLLRMLGATSGSHARPPPIHHPFPQNPCKFKAEWREKNIIRRFRRIPAKYPQNTRIIPAKYLQFDLLDLMVFCFSFCIFIFGSSGCLRSRHSQVLCDPLLNNSTSHRHA